MLQFSFVGVAESIETYFASEPPESPLDKALNEFNQIYPSELDCMRGLCSKSVSKTCARCSTKLRIERIENERFARCYGCGQLESVTAGTFFSGIRKPKAWLATIWLLEKGLCPSGNWLHRRLEISYSTAWKILKKVSIVVHNALIQEDSSKEASSADFIAVYFRRCKKTPADKHPRQLEPTESEQSPAIELPLQTGQLPGPGTTETETGTETEKTDISPLEEENSDTTGSSTELESATFPGTLNGLKKVIYEALAESPRNFDSIVGIINESTSAISAALLHLELEGLIGIDFGGRFYRPDQREAHRDKPASTCSRAIKSGIDAVVAFLKYTNQGIARRYLELYLALFWCQLKDGCWTQGKLLTACAQAAKISDRDILSICAPIKVRLIA